MPQSFFITMTSQDRPGVLAAVTTAFAELGGDMKYATQVVVHGLFTMTVAADFPPHRSWEVIRDHLHDAGRPYDMAVLIRAIPPENNVQIHSGERYFLSVTGHDAPGVVRALCALLAQRLVDIQRLFAVPNSSESFSLVMQLNIPESTEAEELSSELETFGALNGLNVVFQHEEIYNVSDFPREIATEFLPETQS
ncbi:MAG: ACT domain-containing protein [Planctomycetaceae bacterium]|nr:ACT domain-containing protein [Planctomycetaceae bacterium]